MTPTPPKRPDVPPADYRRGVILGALVMLALAFAGWAAGVLAADVIQATGWPLWWGVAFGPVVTLALVILAGVGFAFANRGRSRHFGRGVFAGVLSAAVLYVGAQVLGAWTAAALSAAGASEAVQIVVQPLPVAALLLLVIWGLLRYGRRLD